MIDSIGLITEERYAAKKTEIITKKCENSLIIVSIIGKHGVLLLISSHLLAAYLIFRFKAYFGLRFQTNAQSLTVGLKVFQSGATRWETFELCKLLKSKLFLCDLQSSLP
jgi:hypothetical protein